MAKVVAIVEGHGEVEAVPILLRRIAEAAAPGTAIDIPKPIRVGRKNVLKEGELERTIELAARQSGSDGRILVLIDADDDCPAQLAPKIRARAVSARGDRRICVVLAKAEYEAWFLAAAASIAGRRGIAADVTAPTEPESVRDPKRWLTDRMPAGRSYRETLDQPALTASFDFDQARRMAPSFDKLWRDVRELIS